MKRFFFSLAAVCMAAVFMTSVNLSAQSAEEILNKMDEVMSSHEDEGMAMTVDIKLPIIGTISSRSYSYGYKTRMEVGADNAKLITFTDKNVSYTYNSKDNEITIESLNLKGDVEPEGDAEMFSQISDEYDVSITKETDKAWYILCKKKKSNKDKDAPKTMDLVVAKDTYMPISLSAKVTGTSLTMKDISYGIEESFVTFNQADYPDAKIIDKRKK